MLRSSLLGLFILVGLAFTNVSQSNAQTGKDESMTVQEFKGYLAQTHRDLSMAKQEELTWLKPGTGSFGEIVYKTGTSVFILNGYLILIGFIFLFTILLFFTPIGMIFGGALHNILGSLLGNSGFGACLKKISQHKKEKKHGARGPFATWMIHDFIPHYKNNVTAVAFIGTAFLIANIGFRGIKFMVAHQPTMIILAIMIEVSVLVLLGVTTWYEPEDEDEEGDGKPLPGKQLTLAEVQSKLKALEDDLAASVNKEAGMR
jgi:hypothetical protein